MNLERSARLLWQRSSVYIVKVLYIHITCQMWSGDCSKWTNGICEIPREKASLDFTRQNPTQPEKILFRFLLCLMLCNRNEMYVMMNKVGKTTLKVYLCAIPRPFNPLPRPTGPKIGDQSAVVCCCCWLPNVNRARKISASLQTELNRAELSRSSAASVL